MASKIRHIGFSLALLAVAIVVTSVADGADGDPILEFYRERAASTFQSRNPLARAVSFSCRARTYYMNISDDGEATRLDSGVTDYYYSFGQLDSTRVVLKPEHDQRPLNLNYVNVFDDSYEFYFFPNDTGGPELAIGFDSFHDSDTLPVGLAVIDRDRYSLRWLHLHYPNRQYYRRFSRSFRFVEVDGYVFPDSVWQVSAKQGVFSIEFFRTETGISDITIYR